MCDSKTTQSPYYIKNQANNLLNVFCFNVLSAAKSIQAGDCWDKVQGVNFFTRPKDDGEQLQTWSEKNKRL